MTVMLPKLAYRYPADPVKRVRPDEQSVDAEDYVSAADSAIRAPVRYINEKLGLRTFACCEGHFKDDEDGFSHMLDSYISIRFPYERKPLIHLLKKRRFESKTFRGRCGSYFEAVDDNDEPLVEMKVKTETLFSKTIYPRDMFRSSAFPPKELVLCGSFTEWEVERAPDLCLRIRSTKDLIQPRWDMFRDHGWRYWAGLLAEWKQAQ